MTKGRLPFDNMVSAYFGAGFNPPSIHFSVFAIITLFLLWSVFSILETVNWKWLHCVLDVLSLGGKIHYISLCITCSSGIFCLW